ASRAARSAKTRTRNTTRRGRDDARDDDGPGDQQRAARRDAAGRPGHRVRGGRRPERRRIPMHGGPARRVPGPRVRHAPRGRRDHRDRDRDGAVRAAPCARDPIHGLHLPRVRSDRLGGGEDALPVRGAVHRPHDDPHAVRRRHPRRPLSQSVDRGVLLSHAGPEGRGPVDAETKAADKGVEADVIDLRTLVPLDEPTVPSSVRKTGRAVVVYEAPRTGGYGAEISAILAEKAIEYLRGPIVRVTGFDTPFPYTLEDVYLPNADRVLAAIDKVMAF